MRVRKCIRRSIRTWMMVGVLTAFVLTSPTIADGLRSDHGEILDQQLDGQGQGYTVLRVWGSYYQMGHAKAELMGDFIVQGVNETKAYLGVTNYNALRDVMAAAVWMPPEIEDEFDGCVDRLAISHPAENIDEFDLKVSCTLGEWLYGCRSHTCWGRYVEDPIKTLSTRRLDFGTPIPSMNHHVLYACEPDDGSVRWVNLAWPGVPLVAQAVNEFGTLVSLHDYNSSADLADGRMPRMVAARYAVTYVTDPDASTHLDTMWNEFQNYEIMTGGFLNYYAPEGHGGVMVKNPWQTGPDFYYLRQPQEVWHHGEAMITTNAWTDGTYTPADENFGADAYYDNETPKTHESHWDLLANAGNGLQQLSVAYRGRCNMTIWADGRLSYGRTPRLEFEWCELFPVSGDINCDGVVNIDDIFAVLGFWGDCPDPCPPYCTGDLTEDCAVNIDDIFAILGMWGPCE